MSLLEIRGLNVNIGQASILENIDLSLNEGEVLGLVGESGSGKSMTALALMQLLPHGAQCTGSISFDGKNILQANEDEMCRLRGDDIGMVFQEPMTALNPVKTIGEQVAEGIRWHTSVSRANAEDRARSILDRVGLPQSRISLSRYPHELSGGQRQRVVIAIACALNPRLLIADEPTTALDVVLQAQILELLRDLVEENRMALILISHDLAVVADMAKRIAIMRNGEVVDRGETAKTLTEQNHPYTRQLVQASVYAPKREARSSNPQSEPLLSIENVCRYYKEPRQTLFGKRTFFKAVDDVSFQLAVGQSMALVGRSGCGKSTLARLILALEKPTAGRITLLGQDLSDLSETELRPLRRNMQVVFQDPYGSFDPRHKVSRLVTEPLYLLEKKASAAEQYEMAVDALESVGMSASDLDKFPHEFSGGQRQRISIARAIINKPKLIICDEPVSALDVSIRAQVLDLFADLSDRLGVAYLFITHDLNVAQAIADDVLVMHEGKIVEQGNSQNILKNPNSKPARDLVAAMPRLDKALSETKLHN